MKTIFTLLASYLLATILFAQTPGKISYQAVIRNTSNVLISNQSIGMQVSILQGSVTGTVVYTETQSPTTNTNGLISIEIGNGTVVNGSFDDISWSEGIYFVKTEVDVNGGANYTIEGVSQLLSVPYALHAKTAEVITGDLNELDPVFSNSVAEDITAADTTKWNNQLDSTDIANLGFMTQNQNDKAYFSATGTVNNTLIQEWTTEKHCNKIDTFGTANILKVEEEGLYYIGCTAGISSSTGRMLLLYVNDVLVRSSNLFSGATGGTWGQITANWSIYLNSNDLIEIKINGALWDGGSIDNLSVFKVN